MDTHGGLTPVSRRDDNQSRSHIPGCVRPRWAHHSAHQPILGGERSAGGCFEAEEKARETTTVAEHTRKRRSSRVEEVLTEDVPVEVVEHYPDEAALVCPECGSQMSVIGKEVRRSLVMIPAQVKIREDVYDTYSCQRCKKESTETPIVKAKKVPTVIPGSDCPHHGAEVCDGLPAVPAGTGVEPGRGKIIPADDEQLDPAGSGGLAPAGI